MRKGIWDQVLGLSKSKGAKRDLLDLIVVRHIAFS